MNELKRLDWGFLELIENSGDVFIVVEDNFKIRYVSSSVLRLYGVDPVTIVGRSVFDFVNHERIEGYKYALVNSKSGRSYEIEMEFKKGVKTFFDVFVTPTLQEDVVKGYALKLHDITKKKVKERELIDTNKQLDQVIYKTTHDLKAPLQSAIGLLNLAEKAPVDQHAEYFSLIKRSLLRLSSFIEEMNHFFRNEKLALQRERIEVGEMLTEEIDNLKNLYQSGKIKVSFQVTGSVDFYSDLVRVKTIVTNILTNAIKYSDPDKIAPYITVNATVNSDYCEFTFTDNGIGIEREFLDKIFDLFYRATTQSQGTGIGLFIVKDTIERLNGRIEVLSEIKKGTTFKIRIPNQLYQTADLN